MTISVIKNYFVRSWNEMDEMGRFGQIISLPVSIPLTIFCIASGNPVWALVASGLVYANWKSGAA